MRRSFDGNPWRRLAPFLGLCLLAPALACHVGERAPGGSALSPALLRALASAAVAPDGIVACGDQYLEALEPNISFTSDSTTAGETTGFALFISNTPDPTLETYTAVVTLPAGFTFLGFDALGPGAQVGEMAFDFFWNNVFENVDFSFPAFAVDANTAYGDSLANVPSMYDVGIDPFATVAPGGGGTTVVTLTLPMGGADGDQFGGDRDCTYFSADTRFTLFDGIFRLPQTPGDYTIDVLATSVDMDTGDVDDGMGFTPLVFQRSVMVTVPEPGAGLLGLIGALAVAALRRRAQRRSR